MSFSRRQWVAVLALIAVTAAVYAPVTTFDFVNHDDDRYLLQNPMVQQGLGPHTVQWAFSTLYFSNWHPLTWLSYLVDIKLFGLQPGPLHGVNLLLHLGNVMLLAMVLHRMTGGFAPSLAVAALFALHPLHVESVAWISERKDVLSTLFWLLAMLSYADFVHSGRRRPYLLCLLWFVLGLLAKPMVITLPFVLLLCDYWPLARKVAWNRLIAEKVPLFALAGLSAIITILAQQRGEALGSLDALPLWARLANAVVAYGAYLWKTVWPADLSPFYPHPGTAVEAWKVGVSLVVLLAVSALTWRVRQQRPYALVGWLWYLGTLVPVIGLVQVGSQAMADRYTYVPLIGIFIMVVGLVTGWAVVGRKSRVVWAGAAAIAAVLSVICAHQVQIWRDSVTLFEHALAVTPDNSMVHTNLGAAYAERGRFAEAIPHFEAVRSSAPDSARSYYNLALAHDRLGKADEAQALYQRTLELDPNYWDARNNLGMILVQRRDFDAARAQFQRVLDEDPSHLMALINLGDLEAAQGRPQQAAASYEKTLAILPTFALAYYKLARLHHDHGRDGEAGRLLEESLRLNPLFHDAQVLLGAIRAAGQR